MTGYDLYKKVCALLGYQDLAENENIEKSTAFCSIINQITEDLGLSEIKSLSDNMSLQPKFKEALIYGCAMLFSVSLNDSGCAKMYSQLYNCKRSKALCKTETRYDILPKPQVGGM